MPWPYLPDGGLYVCVRNVYTCQRNQAPRRANRKPRKLLDFASSSSSARHQWHSVASQPASQPTRLKAHVGHVLASPSPDLLSNLNWIGVVSTAWRPGPARNGMMTGCIGWGVVSRCVTELLFHGCQLPGWRSESRSLIFVEIFMARQSYVHYRSGRCLDINFVHGLEWQSAETCRAGTLLWTSKCRVCVKKYMTSSFGYRQ